MKKSIKRLLKGAGIALYAALSVVLTLFAGCSTAMPTRVPPLTEAMGYKVPSWKGWTLVLFNQASYKIESEKLKVWAIMQDLVNRPAMELHGEAINIWSMVATGGLMGLTAGLPAALKKVPKGYRKEDDETVA